YVSNNPLAFIDPSGFCTEEARKAGGCDDPPTETFPGCEGGGGCTGPINSPPPAPPPPTLSPPQQPYQPHPTRPSNHSGGGSANGTQENQDQLETVTVTAKQCPRTSSDESLGDQVTDSIVGFGDAFLIPILVRAAFDINGTVDFNSSAYTGGMIGGTIW